MEVKNVRRFIRKPIGRSSLPDTGTVDRSATAFRQAGARRTATGDRSGICVGVRLAASAAARLAASTTGHAFARKDPAGDTAAWTQASHGKTKSI